MLSVSESPNPAEFRPKSRVAPNAAGKSDRLYKNYRLFRLRCPKTTPARRFPLQGGFAPDVAFQQQFCASPGRACAMRANGLVMPLGIRAGSAT
jgi:hypothetical protein